MQKNNQVSPYILSTNTFALQTVHTKNGIETLIIEGGDTFTHPKKPVHLIRSACQHYGTTFNVATNQAKRILHNRHKVPILVAFNRGAPLIMIPTMSASSEQNVWIAFHAITNFKADDLGHTIIYLLNNHSIRVNASEATVQRQISLAHILQTDYQSKYSYLDGHKFSHTRYGY